MQGSGDQWALVSRPQWLSLQFKDLRDHLNCPHGMLSLFIRILGRELCFWTNWMGVGQYRDLAPFRLTIFTFSSKLICGHRAQGTGRELFLTFTSEPCLFWGRETSLLFDHSAVSLGDDLRYSGPCFQIYSHKILAVLVDGSSRQLSRVLGLSKCPWPLETPHFSLSYLQWDMPTSICDTDFFGFPM